MAVVTTEKKPLTNQIDPLAPDPAYLAMDQQTIRDLEVFESRSSTSLFHFCNKTKTDGGAAALRRRMQEPFSDKESILAVQASISFICAHRELFKLLPSAYTTYRQDHYARDVLPLVTQQSRVEFFIGALILRANHDRSFLNISRGVQVTCILLRALRTFMENEVLLSATGELGELLQKLNKLLTQTRLVEVPEHDISGLWMKVLRLDQLFRIHERDTLAQILKLTFEIDALVSLADVTAEHDMVLPRLLDGPVKIEASNIRHPLLEGGIGNPVGLNQDGRVLFLTGPNMAGKTTYLRAVAINTYFAHLGIGVCASKYEFVPTECLLTSFSLSDDLANGISFFRAEALRVKAIAECLAEGRKIIALMDEPFKGTNIIDAQEASLAILRQFIKQRDCLFVFSSHLVEIGDTIGTMSHIQFCYFQAGVEGGKLEFDYQLHPGISSQRLGMRVLEEEGIFDLLGESCLT